MMVNREGAHSELNEMVRRDPGGPMDIKMSDARDEKYRKSNIVEFDGISYVQIFACAENWSYTAVLRYPEGAWPPPELRGRPRS